MALAPDTPSTVGQHVCVQLFEYPLCITKLQSGRTFFLQKLIIKGEIIHKWTVAELWFFHATHRLLLGIMCVQLFEYPFMHNKVTEWKDIFFYKFIIKGEIIHQQTVVELWFLHATHRLLLGNMCVQLFEYPLVLNKVTERKRFFSPKSEKGR